MGKTKKKAVMSSEPPAPEYPIYMKMMWRFIRVGLASGISSAMTIQFVLSPDWSNSKAGLLTLSAAFFSGFISSTAMALRDWLSKGDYNADIQKLPL